MIKQCGMWCANTFFIKYPLRKFANKLESLCYNKWLVDFLIVFGSSFLHRQHQQMELGISHYSYLQFTQTRAHSLRSVVLDPCKSPGWSSAANDLSAAAVFTPCRSWLDYIITSPRYCTRKCFEPILWWAIRSYITSIFAPSLPNVWCWLTSHKIPFT